jgi:hypothetical protein
MTLHALLGLVDLLLSFKKRFHSELDCDSCVMNSYYSLVRFDYFRHLLVNHFERAGLPHSIRIFFINLKEVPGQDINHRGKIYCIKIKYCVNYLLVILVDFVKNLIRFLFTDLRNSPNFYLLFILTDIVFFY